MPDITTVYEYRCDLTSGARCIELPTPLMYRDAYADVFCVTVLRGDAPVDLTGAAVTGRMHFLATGQTVEVNGSVQSADSSASVVLSPDCYALPGRFMLSMQLLLGTVKHTVLCLTGMLTRTYSDNTTLPATGGASGSAPGTTIDLSSFIDDDVSSTATSSIKAWSSRKAQAMLDEKLQGTGGGDLTGAVRFDIEQGLEDAQKAQARANIGVTSTGADISGIIDDDTANTTGDAETVWSSQKSQFRHDAQGILINSINARIGTLDDLDTTDHGSIVAAINEVNAKVSSGTGGSSGGTVLTYGNCIGDSLMEGAGTTDADGDGAADYDTYSVPALLAAKTGLTMRNYGVGEEMIATIVGRQGGMPMIIKPINLDGTMQYPTIPANAVGVNISAVYFGSLAGESVTPLLKTSRMAVVGDGDINPCTIAGVEGTLTYDKDSSMYTFTRTSVGGAVPLKAPTIIRTKQMKDAGEGQFLLIWMGQNNTTDTTLNEDADAFADYLIERCKNAIDYAKTDKYIILGSPLANGYANATATAYKPIYSRMQSEFGMHYINIVDYLITYAMDEYNLPKTDTSIGMTSTSDDADIAMYRIPTSLRAVKKDTSGTITGPDYVHLNGTGYSIVADQVYKRGRLLGYWT